MGIKAQGDLTKDFFESFTDEHGGVKAVKATELETFMHQAQEDALAKGTESKVVKQFFDYIPIHVLLPWLQALTPVVNENKENIARTIAEVGSDRRELIGRIELAEEAIYGNSTLIAAIKQITNHFLYGTAEEVKAAFLAMEEGKASEKYYIYDSESGDIYWANQGEWNMHTAGTTPLTPIWGEGPTDTYDPEGEKPVSGKAVAEALGTIKIPEVEVAQDYDPLGEKPVSGKAVDQAMRAPSGVCYVDDLLGNPIAATIKMGQHLNGKSVSARIFVADKATEAVYFLSASDAIKAANGEFVPSLVWEMPKNSFDPEGTSAVSGKAVNAAFESAGIAEARSVELASGTTSGYQIEFRIPDEVCSGGIYLKVISGSATLQYLYHYGYHGEGGETTVKYFENEDGFLTVNEGDVISVLETVPESYNGYDFVLYFDGAAENLEYCVYAEAPKQSFVPCICVEELPQASADTMNQVHECGGNYYVSKYIDGGLTVGQTINPGDALFSTLSLGEMQDLMADKWGYDYNLLLFTVKGYSTSMDEWVTADVCWYANSYDYNDGKITGNYGSGGLWVTLALLDKEGLTYSGLRALLEYDYGPSLRDEIYIAEITEIGRALFGSPHYEWFDFLGNSHGGQAIKGEKGDTGEAGADGYTPVKGTDYWTDADKVEICEYLLSNMAAYPVEIGTSGGWKYKKWSDGEIELWGEFSVAVDCTTAWGSLFYGKIDGFSIPEGLLIGTPYMWYNFRDPNTWAIGGAVSKSGTGSFFILSAESKSITSATMIFHLKGAWK